MDNTLPQKNNNPLSVRLPGILDNKAFSEESIDIINMVKRTERISSALYLITGFFPENDPLTFRLREVSVSLLSLMSHFIGESRREIMGKSKEAHRITIELVSLLDTAKLAGFVSDMNFGIISDEIEKVAVSLRAIVTSEGTSILLDDSFFDVPKDSLNHKVAPKRPIYSPIPAQKEKNGPVDMKRKSRRESILSVIRKQDMVGIKEISNTIKDCSEKTIQRELLSLVAEGVLKKQGERRWSVYSFA